MTKSQSHESYIISDEEFSGGLFDKKSDESTTNSQKKLSKLPVAIKKSNNELSSKNSKNVSKKDLNTSSTTISGKVFISKKAGIEENTSSTNISRPVLNTTDVKSSKKVINDVVENLSNNENNKSKLLSMEQEPQLQPVHIIIETAQNIPLSYNHDSLHSNETLRKSSPPVLVSFDWPGQGNFKTPITSGPIHSWNYQQCVHQAMDEESLNELRFAKISFHVISCVNNYQKELGVADVDLEALFLGSILVF